MLCRNPYQPTGTINLYPCGQCMNCRINRRREWTHRLLLETTQHSHNSFITLTYTEETLPSSSTGLSTLNPRHVQLFFKRLRSTLTRSNSPTIVTDLNIDRSIRFYCVGEYGDTTSRPHYHAAIFGFPSCRRGRTQFSRRTNSCCEICDLVLDAWSLGHVYIGDLTRESAAYIAGYVTKKMTSKDDPRLNGRHPEFARMSNRPGIGAFAMYDVADTVLKHGVETPHVLRHGRAMLPLGRYLHNKLQDMTGAEENKDQYNEEMLSLSARAIAGHTGSKRQHIQETETRARSAERISKIRSNKRETL